MKLELTERQAEALINAIETFNNTFDYDYQFTREEKQDLRSALVIQAKLKEQLGA
jgi:hypothetical protein